MAHYHHVRLVPTCAGCLRPKEVGLLLCWPCHRAEKLANGGGYSREMEEKLEGIERGLGRLESLESAEA